MVEPEELAGVSSIATRFIGRPILGFPFEPDAHRQAQD
jgi:hypothetical protein